MSKGQRRIIAIYQKATPGLLLIATDISFRRISINVVLLVVTFATFPKSPSGEREWGWETHFWYSYWDNQPAVNYCFELFETFSSCKASKRNQIARELSLCLALSPLCVFVSTLRAIERTVNGANLCHCSSIPALLFLILTHCLNRNRPWRKQDAHAWIQYPWRTYLPFFSMY